MLIYPKFDIYKLIGFYILSIPLVLFKYYISLIPLFLIISIILKVIDEKTFIYPILFIILYLISIYLLNYYL